MYISHRIKYIRFQNLSAVDFISNRKRFMPFSTFRIFFAFVIVAIVLIYVALHVYVHSRW